MSGKVIKISAIAVGLLTLTVAGYIMFNHIGLVDTLDFGAGAYYYADIPEFDKLEKGASFVSRVPLWVHILLFLAWGFLMYRLWLRIDRNSSTS